MKVVIVSGNGSGDVFRSNWYGWLYDELNKTDGITCMLENMPDPLMAREKIWIPFMRDTLACDGQTVIVGHSSGAQAAMRFAEGHKIKGIVLVSACVTDLGIESERKSGYYNRPWNWELIKENSDFILQFGSTDDPFIPWLEQQQVADGLKSDLYKFDDKGHFMSSQFPDLLQAIKTSIC